MRLNGLWVRVRVFCVCVPVCGNSDELSVWLVVSFTVSVVGQPLEQRLSSRRGCKTDAATGVCAGLPAGCLGC